MREEMRNKAIQHSALMSKTYDIEIKKCIKNSKIYDIDFELPKHYVNNKNIEFTLLHKGSSDAVVYGSTRGKTAVLNFASYKNPGGGYLTGMTTQEEALCHDSFLFNVLIEMKDYYIWNRQNLNKGLYMNRAIYSPNVYFDKQNRYADIITCAAPNFSLKKYQNITKEENSEALKSRINFVLDIAEDNQVDTLILGAFGCGVFGQDAKEVARLWVDGCKQRHFKHVIFPIIDKGYNYEAFVEVLNEEHK